MAVKAVLAESPVVASGDGCPRGSHWVINKFGGTCMASAERIKGVAELMVQQGGQNVIVVSAMGSAPTSPVKVTDLILSACWRLLDGGPGPPCSVPLHLQHRGRGLEAVGGSGAGLGRPWWCEPSPARIDAHARPVSSLPPRPPAQT